MPNLYFTRDPFASVGNGVTIHKMRTKTRTRESLFAKYIFTYHPMYKDTRIWYDRYRRFFSLEGGDILILNEKTIAIGISQRTHENAIEKFANEILGEKTTFEKVLAFQHSQRAKFHAPRYGIYHGGSQQIYHPSQYRRSDYGICHSP